MLNAHSVPLCGSNAERFDAPPPGPSPFLLRAVLCAARERLGLTDRAVDVLLRQVQFASWGAGRRIPAQATGGEVVRLLVSGAVRIVCVGGPLGWVTVRIVPPGWLLQQPAEQVRHTSLEAHVPSLVAVLARRTLEGLLLERAGTRFLDLACRGWETLADTVLTKTRLLTLALRDRLLHELDMLAHDFGREHPAGVLIDLPLSHADLAGLVAATRPSVSRAMTDLRSEGRLEYDQRRIVVVGARIGQARSSWASGRPGVAVP